MEINKEPTPITGGVIILDGNQIREMHVMAMTMDSFAGILSGMAIRLRQLAGRKPEDPQVGN